ncbi:hypothetical protein KY311_00740 [Candidatus Woesearchaeota archaeon]|nr:hypothetical protein [Candidatus Woesearchaeota archaeon]
MEELETKVENVPDEGKKGKPKLGEKYDWTRERTMVARCEKQCDKLSQAGSSFRPSDAFIVRIRDTYSVRGEEGQKDEIKYYCSLGYSSCPKIFEAKVKIEKSGR